MYAGEDGATIEGAVKLVKYAFCFEQWEVFEALNDTVLAYLRVSRFIDIVARLTHSLSTFLH